ncbi:ATP-binding cassette domain-containing protein [Ruminococcus flavefaciens]|uniref:ABC-2 type transport system ATP-binding protein n=1 Tax=Ruminococcus flavefaciens TaxID=1265 RepID=A0A315YKH9_RUMFL|nr:ATP-binding cassette domain-containing protein [Ruminococcus flavefaciens]PWJ11912.1 ABC-2 type transport system ATP-binding protein [Ruminococcus flavefaciens]SSA50134.1 ABC-2 type transport system ATP-binding protein [Ruminococcus flavefaciens]
MDYVLRTNALTKHYKDFKALNGLTMNVPKGSIYGFVGRNGAGKTTLIRMVCGIQFPTDGSFELYGVKNSDPKISETRRRMGAVVETPSILPYLSARKNLEMQYDIMGMPDYNGIDELLDLVGLKNTGSKLSRDFSLGMRQRLGIAVALCGKPDFLVLDEPINGLDPQGIIEMRELILKLNRENNITILISSHILDELSKIATHYGFINGGQIVREMSAEELENECRKCVRVKVTDTAALARVLDGMDMEYKIIDDEQADIFASPNITKLAFSLWEEKCEILSVSEHDENLEGFFISLVGGGSNE